LKRANIIAAASLSHCPKRFFSSNFFNDLFLSLETLLESEKKNPISGISSSSSSSTLD
jgi:hypothetical protein